MSKREQNNSKEHVLVQMPEELRKKWRGLPLSFIKFIKEAADRRLKVEWVSQGHDPSKVDDLEIPIGMIQVVAEEVIKQVGNLALLNWEDDPKIQVAKIRPRRR